MILKIFKFIINAIMVLLIIIGVFVVFSFVPFPGNYKIFTVQSGSMQPAIKTGSLIFVRPEKEYSINDVVTRTTIDPKITITHRIVEKNIADGQTVFKTRGDANNAADSENVPQNSIIGKVLLAIPFLGYPVSYAKTTQGIILLIVIPAVIIIYDELSKIKAEIILLYRNRRKKGAKVIELDEDNF